MTFMDKGSIPRTKALTKAFRNAIQLVDIDDEISGEEVMAALATVAAEMIVGQDTEEAGHELYGMLNVAINIAMLKFQGIKVVLPHA